MPALYPDIPVPNAAPAVKLGWLHRKQKVMIRVNTANVTVRYGNSREMLDVTGGGFKITSADGLLQFPWTGEFWVEGLTTNPAIPVITFAIQDR